MKSPKNSAVAHFCFLLSTVGASCVCCRAQGLITFPAKTLKNGGALAGTADWYVYDNINQQGRTRFNKIAKGENGNVDNTMNPEVMGTGSDAFSRFKLHTYNPVKGDNREDIFQGTELYKVNALSKLPVQNDPSSVVIRAKIRINSIPKGAVFGFYAVQPDAGKNAHEIDVEFLGNFLTGEPPKDPVNYQNLWLNIHKDKMQLSEANASTNPRLEANYWLGWHTYTIKWSRQSVTWQIDDVSETTTTAPNSATADEEVLKRVTSLVPTQPLQVHLNAWVPSNSEDDPNYFPQAARDGIAPASLPEQNHTFSYDVQWVQMGKGLTAKGIAKVNVP